MMRIITGTARGAHLVAPQGDTTRPTAERAKEAIFSALPIELENARVLDLFAGSGQMGLEAVSRGAAFALFVDHSPAAAEAVRQNIKKVRFEEKCEFRFADAAALLRTPPKTPFDLVFLDPPYDAGLLPSILAALLFNGGLSDGAMIVCECRAGDDPLFGDAALAARFLQVRTARYGAARVDFLKVRESV